MDSATAPSPPAPTVPAPATDVLVLGPMVGSGYRVPPHLVRLGGGQIVQVTPLLAAVLEAIDGQRDLHGIAERAGELAGRPLHPDDVEQLIEQRLRPLGVLRSGDGSDPIVTRSNPLLGLRGRIAMTSPRRTARIAGPFLGLFHPAVVVAMTLAFAAVSVWALFGHGMGAPVEAALADPALLLVLIGLIVASAAFHEVGHAAACIYGGARPGVMGGAIYLIWPAFYTDVTDSYCLNRAGRLRVDLGGLYFNAVFTVAAAAVWAATGAEALLVLVPVQLLQMVRQLVPLVRFDGYHILADLVGVPDLFSRIRPTLLRAIPWRRDDTPNPLRPWAQAVVVAWVVAVIPALLFSFGLLLLNLPGIVGSAVASLRLQSSLFAQNLDQGRAAAAVLGIVAMTTVAFIPLSSLYLTTRLAHRASTRFWAATDGRPVPRALGAMAAGALLLTAGAGLLPEGPGHGGLDGASAALTAGAGAEFALAGAVDPAVSTDPPANREIAAAEAEAEPRATRTATAPANGRNAPSTGSTATGAPRPVPVEAPGRSGRPSAPPWPFPFDRPTPPKPGDNQAVATNWTDRTEEFAMATSLEWVGGGASTNANQAYALATCTSCRTVAVAFQIVATTQPTATVAPRNEAVAVNYECTTCITRAVAVQLAVTLDGTPDAAARARLKALVAKVNGRRGAFRRADPATIVRELRAARAEALVLLEPWIDSVEESDPADEVAAGSPVAEPTPVEPTPEPTTTTTTTTAPDTATEPTPESDETTTSPSTEPAEADNSSSTTTEPPPADGGTGGGPPPSTEPEAAPAPTSSGTEETSSPSEAAAAA